ncbi:hypothetical protein HN51_012416 [Arachis hypogaea]
MNSQGRERRLRCTPVRAIVTPVAAASDDEAVAKARVTVVLAPVADEAHSFLLLWFAEREARGWRKADGEKNAARRAEQIQAAHDEAMFGASALPPPTSTDSELERENEKEVDKKSCCYKPLKWNVVIAALYLLLVAADFSPSLLAY